MSTSECQPRTGELVRENFDSVEALGPHDKALSDAMAPWFNLLGLGHENTLAASKL